MTFGRIRVGRVACALVALAGVVPAVAAERPLVVVVDAGHGGHDPGSLSPSQHKPEKSVTLAIARGVRSRLGGKREVRLILTRSDDRFLTLVERRRIAEAAHADLFVSIHADSAPSPVASGASVYTLTEDGRAVVVNRMAGASDLDGITLAGLDRDTAMVLGDLKQRFAMNSSLLFATRVSDSLSAAMPLRAHYLQSARFAVLKAQGIPSVLIETGYVTNRDDAAELFSKSGQARIAKAIARAILDTARDRAGSDDDRGSRVATLAAP